MKVRISESEKRFSTWNQKFLPYSIEVSEKGDPVLTISIDKLEPAVAEPDSAFVLEGVAPVSLAHTNDRPALVMPQAKVRVTPDNPSHLRGNVVVVIQIDVNGHVAAAEVQRSGGAELDALAVDAAKQWEFIPMQIAGKPVPTSLSLTFRF